MSNEATLLLIMVLPLLLSPLAYLRAERLGRRFWEVVDRPPFVSTEGAAYRAPQPLATGMLDRAPALVRVAACSSIMLGSMFVPGLLLGLYGLLAGAGIGLVSIPGLVIAGWLWSVGHRLLCGGGAASARKVAAFSLALNVLIVGGVIAAALFSTPCVSRVLPPTEAMLHGLAHADEKERGAMGRAHFGVGGERSGGDRVRERARRRGVDVAMVEDGAREALA